MVVIGIIGMGRMGGVWGTEVDDCFFADLRFADDTVFQLMEGVCESGLEGGFSEDLVPFLDGEPRPCASMYEASKTVKTLDLIRTSSSEGRLVQY
jgi:hypothetical protein